MIDGFQHLPGFLDPSAQISLLGVLRPLVAQAPLYRPVMPRSGKPFSVRMTNLGQFGWVSDVSGYRYETRHPVTRAPWPAIPECLFRLWADVLPGAPPPQACLVNDYEPGARMGLHQDRDEDALDCPVLSLSLGDSALFRIGGTRRSDPTKSLWLASGDVVVLGGEARMAFHGVDRIKAGSSDALARSGARPDSPSRSGGRLNLTLRRVTRP